MIDADAEPGLVAPPEAVALTPPDRVIVPEFEFVAVVVAVMLTPKVPPGEIETEFVELLSVEPGDAVTAPMLIETPEVEKPGLPGDEKKPENVTVTVNEVSFV